MKVNTLSAADKAFLKRLGARIRKLRQDRNWTLEETEEHGWPDWTHLQKVETGKNITVVTFKRIARLFRVTPAQLWGDSDGSPEATVIPFDPEQRKRPRGAVPLYDIAIAAGTLEGNESEAPEPTGWVKVDRKGSLEDYFAARVTGRSMEPTIHDGALCLFKRYSGGTRQGKIMLARARGLADPEHGGKFVIKEYRRKGAEIHLISHNPKFAPIVLKGLSEGEITTPCEYVESL